MLVCERVRDRVGGARSRERERERKRERERLFVFISDQNVPEHVMA
jgi:hypothetical protein